MNASIYSKGVTGLKDVPSWFQYYFKGTTIILLYHIILYYVIFIFFNPTEDADFDLKICAITSVSAENSCLLCHVCQSA